MPLVPADHLWGLADGMAMDTLKLTAVAFTAVAGALVLGSYVLGIKRAATPADLWGGVTPAMQKAIVPFMLVAAAGFLAFFILVVFVGGTSVMEQMRWPWMDADGNGGARLLWSLALFLIPAIFWLETTNQYLANPSTMWQVLTIGGLVITGVGTIMLTLLGYAAWQDGVTGGLWIFLGAAAIAIQCAVNDAIIWVAMFPWKGS